MFYPLVSIIIPVYNKEIYLNQAISSALKQTYMNIEYIIINDGSTDNSAQVIENWVNEDDRIKYINQKNKGVSSTRNKGMDLAKGDYIFFFDADDQLDKNAITNLLNIARNNKYDIIAANFSKVVNGREIKKSPLVEKLYTSDSLDNEQVKAEMFLFNGRPLSTVCNKLYKKSFLKKSEVKFENGVLAEDRLFNLMCFVNKPNIYVTNIYTYLYNIIDDSRSRSYSSNLYQSIIELYSVFEIYIKNKEFSIDIRELLLINISYDIDNIIKYEYDFENARITTISNRLKAMYSNQIINEALKTANINNIFRNLKYKKLNLLRRRLFLNLLRYRKVKTLSLLSLIYRKLIDYKIKR